MDFERVLELLAQGREIEFSFGGHRYFVAPLYRENTFIGKYSIFDCGEKTVIYAGTLCEILAFEFAPEVSFNNAGHLFSLEYVM